MSILAAVISFTACLLYLMWPKTGTSDG